jgi:hypothetical protein
MCNDDPILLDSVVIFCILTCKLRARIVEGGATSIARECLGDKHTSVTTNTHAAIGKLLEALFSVGFIPGLNIEARINDEYLGLASII